MSFQQGLSGLAAASKNLDVMGNNIANASTVGFKQSRTEFADVYANSMYGSGGTAVGIGTQIVKVAQQFTQGNISLTNNPLDVAVNGDGFFRLSDQGAISYTRNGQFRLDKDGYLVTNSGLNVMGYTQLTLGPNNSVVGASALGNIQVNLDNLDPQATTEIFKVLNLDAQLPSISTATSFSANNPASYNYSSALTVYDSVGAEHSMTLYYTKRADHVWEVNGMLDGATQLDMNVGAPGMSHMVMFNPDGTLMTSGTGFDISGQLNQDVAVGDAAGPFPISVGGVSVDVTFTKSASDRWTVSAALTNPPNTVIDLDPAGGGTDYTVTFDPATGALTSGGFVSGISVPGATTPIYLNFGGLVQGSVTNIALAYNAATAGAATVTGALDRSLPSSTLTMTVTDSDVGAATQNVDLTFTKTGVNTWVVSAVVPGAPPSTIDLNPGDPGSNTVSLTFDDVTGLLSSGGSVTGISIPGFVDTFDFDLTGLTAEAVAAVTPSVQQTMAADIDGLTQVLVPAGALGPNPLVIDLSFAGSTQFAGSSGVTDVRQDGYGAGRIVGVSIDGNGIISGRYTNGLTRPLQQLVLANFRNPGALVQLGNNQWAAVSESGSEILNVPGEGVAGLVQSGATEDANVDLTAELVNLIVAQRLYQANAQTIRAQDQILQTLVNLR